MSDAARPLRVFLACLPGLEPLAAREASELLAIDDAVVMAGGVELATDARGLHRVMLGAGLVSHVLVRVASFHVRSLEGLAQHVARLPWSGWIAPGTPRRVRATTAQTRLWHSGAVIERVEYALRERLGDDPPPPDDTSPTLVARVIADRCTLSLDVSGPLHKRGYRLDPGLAPLREDVARALLVVSGWDRESALLDPFTGSGTLAIEAALLASRTAPGLHQASRLSRTRLFDAQLDADERARASAERRAAPEIFASDVDARAIARAREIAARAGVEELIRFSVSSVSEAPVPERAGALVANPPWGARLGDAAKLRPLYRALGRLASSLPVGARVAIAAADRRLALASGIALSTAALTDQGGTKVRLMVGTTGGGARRK